MQDNPWKQVSDKFKVGQIVKGPITNITDFGVFIQLMPGIDGLVHISDLSWTEHIAHPADVFKRGQEVEAVILGIDEQNKRVSLGIKQLTPDPWATIEHSYPVGSTVEGEVSKIINFGAFVKLPNGIEGLVHISELSDQNVEKVEDVLKVGQKRQFRVIKISKEDHKLGLSLKTNDFVPEKTKEKPVSSGPQKRGPVRAKSEEMAAKPKSLLQIELEKHAARQKNAADEQANEDKE
jgi:small subunit ribosomal protein S1